MGRKIFVSYKYRDSNVKSLNTMYGNTTVRDYVDYLIENKLDDEIYKGEGNEDLSKFKDETIENRLKDKIHDSSITIVLISPNMKESYTPESDQWIPWEISYSLKEITRADKMSHPNGVLAVVLPDTFGNYDYFIEDKFCNSCNCRRLKTNTLFKILSENMFNAKNLQSSNCNYCNSYAGDSSYIYSVKWQDFINKKDHYLDEAARIRDNGKSYEITKEIKNGW